MALKTNLVKLKAGAEVSFNGSNLGYTRGIAIEFKKDEKVFRNQKVNADVEVIETYRGATISVSCLEYDNANIKALFAQASGSTPNSPTTGTLKVKGRTRYGTDREFVFNKVFRESTGSFDLQLNVDSRFPIVFHALVDANGVLGTIP